MFPGHKPAKLVATLQDCSKFINARSGTFQYCLFTLIIMQLFSLKITVSCIIWIIRYYSMDDSGASAEALMIVLAARFKIINVHALIQVAKLNRNSYAPHQIHKLKT